jgi:hypothetical protein
MSNVEIKSVHISQIQIGDTIEHDGFLRTVSGNNIKKDTFMGTTLFGDSYKMGSIPVKKVVAWVKK